MNDKFVKFLEEGIIKEEKKDDIEETPEKKKRGRPKKEDNDDDSGKEGVRNVKLTAKIKIGKKTEKEEKELKDFDVSKLDDEMKKWEKQLHKKYDFEADDITISKKIGDYDVEDEIDPHARKDSGADPEDDSYGFGNKGKKDKQDN